MTSPDRFAFRIPRECPNCSKAKIRLAHTVKAPLVYLTWHCYACGLQWPLDPKDQGERRVGERRLKARKRVPPKERRSA